MSDALFFVATTIEYCHQISSVQWYSFSYLFVFFQNGSSEVSESASTSSLGSNSSHSKAPGAQLAHKSLPFHRHPLGLELNNKLVALDKDHTLGKLRFFFSIFLSLVTRC